MSHTAPHPEPFRVSATGATSVPVEWVDPLRGASFLRWLAGLEVPYGVLPASLRPASADASFRRYLRVDTAQAGSRIIMDAPPVAEDCRAFAHVAGVMADAGINAPRVLAWDQANGFMLLTDLGNETMMQHLVQGQAKANLGLYLQAVELLLQWQRASKPGVLPVYGEPQLLSEMELFPQWYMAQYRGVVVDADMRQTLDRTFQTIARESLAWPSVYVHQDFMPRNLMLPDPASGPLPQTLGVLDFQDAVYGPITYDIASLMRDAFVSWEEDFVLDVTVRYWDRARAAGLPVGPDFGAFYRGVEWMGLQRHLRIVGTFARLTLRDGKPQYLADTPRFIEYIRATAGRYRELRPLLRLVDKLEGVQDATGYVFGRV